MDVFMLFLLEIYLWHNVAFDNVSTQSLSMSMSKFILISFVMFIH